MAVGPGSNCAALLATILATVKQGWVDKSFVLTTPTSLVTSGGLANSAAARAATESRSAATHVYWASAPVWLREGLAVFFERASENSRAGAPLEGYDTSCQETDNLSFLDRQRLDDSYCHYKLGWGMFYDLYGSLGEERFRHGLRKLYLTLKNEMLTSDSACTGLGRGECSVKAAFIDVADPELAAVVNDVVDRWYYGSERGR